MQTRGRVIAIGTTVAKTLETGAHKHEGRIRAESDWSRLFIYPGFEFQAVDGLLTGLHEPGASHLLMLEAVATPSILRSAYRAAFEAGYLWHEFGDSHLILP